MEGRDGLEGEGGGNKKGVQREVMQGQNRGRGKEGETGRERVRERKRAAATRHLGARSSSEMGALVVSSSRDDHATHARQGRQGLSLGCSSVEAQMMLDGRRRSVLPVPCDAREQ